MGGLLTAARAEQFKVFCLSVCRTWYGKGSIVQFSYLSPLPLVVVVVVAGVFVLFRYSACGSFPPEWVCGDLCWHNVGIYSYVCRRIVIRLPLLAMPLFSSVGDLVIMTQPVVNWMHFDCLAGETAGLPADLRVPVRGCWPWLGGPTMESWSGAGQWPDDVLTGRAVYGSISRYWRMEHKYLDGTADQWDV